MNKEEILEAIKGLSVLDLSELVKALEQEFGVSAAAPVVVASSTGGAAQAAPAAPEEEEKTEFSVVLKEIGANKINVIKAVREVTTLGLREAKELVEGAPVAVKEAIPQEEANTVKQKLEEAGAVVALE